jgi:hypothetical protein
MKSNTFRRRTHDKSGRFLAGNLERRMLLSGTTPNVTCSLISGPSVWQITSGSQITVSAFVQQLSNNNLPGGYLASPITGTVTWSWWNGSTLSADNTSEGGATIASAPLANTSNPPFAANTVSSANVINITVNLSDAIAAGGPPQTSYGGSTGPAAYLLVAEYGGGGGFSACGSPVNGTDLNYVQFLSTNKLAFIQNPSNTAAGDIGVAHIGTGA